jgi:FMN phosphatase YigB (HAD superfamily)
MEYKKLISFDFDYTLCHTLEPLEGMRIWKEKTGADYPFTGWWGRPESMDMDVFDIELNKNTYDEYLKAVSDSSNYVILATGRVEKLRPQVLKILNKYNLSFDGVFLTTGKTYDYKRDLFERLIKEIKPEEFIMYDDREEHIIDFCEWAKTQPCDVTVIDVKKDTTTKIKNIL